MKLTASLMHTLLVACDQSYKTTANGVVTGDVLTYYPDSNGGNPGTDHMPSEWSADLDGWTVAKRIDDAATGFGATVYQKPVDGQSGKFDYIVALQGTRGPSMQDWNDNITYGWKKFNSEYGGRNRNVSDPNGSTLPFRIPNTPASQYPRGFHGTLPCKPAFMRLAEDDALNAPIHAACRRASG